MNLTKKRIRTWKVRARALTLTTAIALILGATLVLPRASATTHASTGGYSARALLARGDAEMEAHHRGRAIADYERARLLAPRSPLISAALAQARASAGLPPLEESRFASALGTLSPNEWSWIALGGLGLAAAAVVGLGWGVRRLGFGAFLVGAVVAAASATAAAETGPSPRSAVVVGSDVAVRIAPFAAADPAFVAAEGSQVTIERTRGAYAWVRSSSGDGWIPVDQIETILPPSQPGA
jgi:hypothetical protein